LIKKDGDKEKELYKKLKYTAEKYQLGISAKKEEEYLVMDEGFCKKAPDLVKYTDFSLGDYFKIVPLLEVIIHIDAPAEICQSRQSERDRIVKPDIKKLEMSRERWFELMEVLESDFGMSVVRIENTGTIENAVSSIQEKLKEIIEF